MHSFIGGELSFLKLGLVLVGFSWGVSNSGPMHEKSIHEVFTFIVCVLTVWLEHGWSLGEDANAYFS